MKTFEDSPLEIICWPLRLSPWHKIIDLNQAYIYEHVFVPVVLAAALSKIPLRWLSWSLYGVACLFHVVVKEMIHDRLKNGQMNWANVVERLYGTLLGALLL